MKKSELLDNLRRVHRVMKGAYERGERMVVWKDDVEAVEAAIKAIEGMETAE